MANATGESPNQGTGPRECGPVRYPVEQPKHEGGGGLQVTVALLTIIGLVLGIVLTLTQLGVLGSTGGDPGGGGAGGGSPLGGDAKLSVSKGTGDSGTEIELRGSGFAPNETVEVLFHVDAIATTRADANGAFRDLRARIPGTYDFMAPYQFRIFALGQSSQRSATVPFELTK